MKKGIIGGIITLVLGGTGYTVSQTDVVKNFSKETGMSQEQAQQYANNAQKNLVSFSKIGQGLIDDSNTITTTIAGIDCESYTYGWESADLSCPEGKNELQSIGNNEATLGNCYSALDTNLGSAAEAKIKECINDIDTLDSSYDLPIAIKTLSSAQISDTRNTNLYNKSVLQTALESKRR